MVDDKEIRNQIECLLFVSLKPVSCAELASLLNISEDEVRRQIQVLQFEYEGRGLQVLEVAGGVKFYTRPAYAQVLKKLAEQSTKALSQAALETLAIVAYKQPITRVEVEKLRGVNVDAVVNTLLERKLIKISGRKEVPGRPFVFRTTNEFLEYFGLKGIEELPKMSAVQA